MRQRSLCKLLDWKDWWWEKLGLALVSRALLSKALIQLSSHERDNSVIFEIAPKYCISKSFVDYEGYSIFCKGFLPTVVDKLVIRIKFAHSCPF